MRKLDTTIIRSGLVLVCCLWALPRQAVAQGNPVPNNQNSQPRTVGVYKADGTRVCQPDAAIPLDEMATELTRSGIRILGEERRLLLGVPPSKCNAPTGRVNYYTIALTDLDKVDLALDHPGHFRVWTDGIPTTILTISSMSQCGDAPVPPDSWARRLIAAGVVPVQQTTRVGKLDRRKCDKLAYDDYAFRIPVSDLTQANALGLMEPPSGKGSGCIGTYYAPLPGGAEQSSYKGPQSRNLILPPLDAVPASLRNIPIATTFYIGARGAVDSVTTIPTLPDPFAKTFFKTMKDYSWQPATFEGCAVASKATITLRLN